jgi:hypothetical protein
MINEYGAVGGMTIGRGDAALERIIKMGAVMEEARHLLPTPPRFEKKKKLSSSSSSYMALQPISGLGLLFMRFRNLTLIDNW